MKRVINWEVVLPQAIEELQSKEFEYAAFDCCCAAGSLVNAITGVDLMADLKPKYSDEATANELIQSLGADLCEAVTKVAAQHDMPVISPRMASRGDLVIAELDGSQIVAVVGTDPRYALCVTLKGLVRIPISKVTKAWRV